MAPFSMALALHLRAEPLPAAAGQGAAAIPLAATAAALPRDHVRGFDEDAAGAGPLIPRALGLRTVALDRIVGSVGRARELRRDFRPRQRRAEDDHRYGGILAALERGEVLPPVDLYKLGYYYYVLDGNHRVAVARQLGQLELDAEVVAFVPAGDEAQRRLLAERQQFERRTGLTRIGSARAENYCALERRILDHAREAGLAMDDLAAAAEHWYHHVWYPVARRLRASRLAERYPGERTADLFLRLATFREQEEARDGRAPTWDIALDRFVREHRSAARRVSWLCRALHRRTTAAAAGGA